MEMKLSVGFQTPKRGSKALQLAFDGGADQPSTVGPPLIFNLKKIAKGTRLDVGMGVSLQTA